MGRDQQKPGEYIDSKGRKVVIDEDGNKTVFDKKGRKLRPKRKQESTDNRQDLMKNSIYNSARFDDIATSNSIMR